MIPFHIHKLHTHTAFNVKIKKLLNPIHTQKTRQKINFIQVHMRFEFKISNTFISTHTTTFLFYSIQTQNIHTNLKTHATTHTPLDRKSKIFKLHSHAHIAHKKNQNFFSIKLQSYTRTHCAQKSIFLLTQTPFIQTHTMQAHEFFLISFKLSLSLFVSFIHSHTRYTQHKKKPKKKISQRHSSIHNASTHILFSISFKLSLSLFLHSFIHPHNTRNKNKKFDFIFSFNFFLFSDMRHGHTNDNEFIFIIHETTTTKLKY